MFKRLDPRDVDKTPFKVYKQFTVTNVDSGSGIYNFRAISGSTKHWTKENPRGGVKVFESASFYQLPAWFSLNNRYYRQTGAGNRRNPDTINNFNNFSPNGSNQYRLLHNSASIISVTKDLYGERIYPKSVELTDDVGSSTLKIVDDGFGNLYDNSTTAGSASFASFFTSSFTNTETSSFVGNVFYESGFIAITNTGSKYINVGTGTGTDGFSLKYKSQITINEYSFLCVAGENEFNTTTNISVTNQRSGSINVSGSDAWRFFPPGHATAKSGSGYGHFYEQATKYEPFVTHSEFRPYVTKVGLYNDFDELLAIGQISHPIKNDKDLAIAFQVRFDA